VFALKLPLHLLAMPRYEDEIRDRRTPRRPAPRQAAPAWPLRWPRKLATALPTSVRVFRRQLAAPISAIDPGTPVVSSRGRALGVVRSMVVEVDSGLAAYAVSPDAHDARVILLPRQSLRGDAGVAVIDDRVAQRLVRRSA
jgi:hypothetical protein